MAIEIKGKNLETIRRLILNTDTLQVVAVDEEDVDHLFESATFMAFQVTHGDNLKEALKQLDPDKIDSEVATKAIFVVCCPESYKFPISDLSDLIEYLSDNLPTAEVRWGLASRTREGDNANVTVVAVTTY